MTLKKKKKKFSLFDTFRFHLLLLLSQSFTLCPILFILSHAYTYFSQQRIPVGEKLGGCGEGIRSPEHRIHDYPFGGGSQGPHQGLAGQLWDHHQFCSSSFFSPDCWGPRIWYVLIKRRKIRKKQEKKRKRKRGGNMYIRSLLRIIMLIVLCVFLSLLLGLWTVTLFKRVVEDFKNFSRYVLFH